MLSTGNKVLRFFFTQHLQDTILEKYLGWLHWLFLDNFHTQLKGICYPLDFDWYEFMNVLQYESIKKKF